MRPCRVELGAVATKTPISNIQSNVDTTEMHRERIHNRAQDGLKGKMQEALKKKYKCWFCDHQVFASYHYMVSHMQRHHAGQFVQCKHNGICAKVFPTEEEKSKHMLADHSGLKKCEFCHRKYDSKYTSYHMWKFHKSDNLFRCSFRYCSAYFRSHEEKQKHVQRNHPVKDNKLKCIFCDMILLNSSMRKHVTAKHEVQMQSAFSCSKRCGRYFFTELERDQHVTSAHKRAPLVRIEVKCIYCNKLCSGIESLNGHTRYHHPDVRIRCRIFRCGQYFHTQAQLDTHFEQVHSKIEESKKFQCSNCDFRSDYKKNLKAHFALKHGVRNIPCPKCAKYFNSSYVLKMHLKCVHGAFYKPCKYCNGKYVNLILHQIREKCKKCQQVLKCKQSASLHKKSCF